MALKALVGKSPRRRARRPITSKALGKFAWLQVSRPADLAARASFGVAICLRDDPKTFQDSVRLLDATLDSFSTFWRDGTLRVAILAPEAVLARAEASLIRVPSVDLVFTPLEAIVPPGPSPQARGGVTADAIACLAAADRSPDDFTLVLQPGSFAARVLTRSVLAPGGRVLTDWERVDAQASRWLQAAALLGWKGPLPAWGLQEGPTALARPLASEALEVLLQAERSSGVPACLEGWDAQAVYSLVNADALRERHQTHIETAVDRGRALHGPADLLTPDALDAWSPQQVLCESDPQAFIRLPPSGLNIEAVLERLYRVLPY